MSSWKSKKEAAAPVAAKSSGSNGSMPKRVTVLDIRTIDTKKGKQAKIQFAKDIEIYFRGEKLDLGEYNSGFLKTKDELLGDLDFLVENEYIDGDEAQKRADFLDEKGITSQFQVATSKS